MFKATDVLRRITQFACGANGAHARSAESDAFDIFGVVGVVKGAIYFRYMHILIKFPLFPYKMVTRIVKTNQTIILLLIGVWAV